MKLVEQIFVIVLFFLIMASSPSALYAQFTVSGQVTDPNSQGVYPVDIDVYDSYTGDPTPVWGDTTDINGYYSIDLYAGTYDIWFIPAPGNGLAPRRIKDVVVQSSLVLDATVPWGYLLSGVITDNGGSPVENVDLDVRHSVTDEVLPTPGDNSDSTGFYDVTIPGGTFDLIFTPRAEDSLSSLTLWDVPVNADTTVNAILPESVILWGYVKNEAGFGILDVDLDVDDALTGNRISTPYDNTDESGFYSIIVPVGVLDIMYEPPEGSGYADNAIWNLVVNRDLNLNVILKNGWVISGRVTDTFGSGIFNVDLDVDDTVTGDRIHTSHDNTDSNGDYSIVVPQGLYNIFFEETGGLLALAPTEIDSQLINSDTVINQTLSEGFFLTGTITDDGSSPVDNCDLDLVDVSTGRVIYTPGDNSDENGDYSVRVPADTYHIFYQPVPESGVQGDTIPSIVINLDKVQNVTLQRLFNQAIALIPESVSIFPGDQLFERIKLFNNDTQARRVKIRLDALLPGGRSMTILPPFPTNGINLAGGGQAQGVLPVNVPAAAPPGLQVTLQGLILDFDQGDTLNVDATTVKILDPDNPANQ